MGHYVYKYVEDNEIIYIGKNDTDLHTRISQHVSEKKFKEHPDAKIYYGELANSVESRFMEMMLINRYKPILNVVDKVEGNSFIDFTEPEWKPYVKPADGRKSVVKKPKPFFREYGGVPAEEIPGYLNTLINREAELTLFSFLRNMYKIGEYTDTGDGNIRFDFDLEKTILATGDEATSVCDWYNTVFTMFKGRTGFRWYDYVPENSFCPDDADIDAWKSFVSVKYRDITNELFLAESITFNLDAILDSCRKYPEVNGFAEYIDMCENHCYEKKDNAEKTLRKRENREIIKNLKESISIINVKEIFPRVCNFLSDMYNKGTYDIDEKHSRLMIFKKENPLHGTLPQLSFLLRDTMIYCFIEHKENELGGHSMLNWYGKLITLYDPWNVCFRKPDEPDEGDFNDYIKKCMEGYARCHEEACTLLEQYKNGEWR